MGFAKKKSNVIEPLVFNWQTYHPIDDSNMRILKEKRVDPLDSVQEVDTLVSYFLEKGRTRDALMCVAQLNFGLRISDILWIRWKDIFNNDGSPKESNSITTQKTGAKAVFFINDAVVEAARLHRNTLKKCDMSDEGYIFVSDRGGRAGYRPIVCRGENGLNVQSMYVQPMNVSSASHIITDAAKATGLYRPNRHVSTHTLRKTALNAVAGALQGLEPDQELLELKSMLKVAQQMAAHASSKTTDIHYLTNRYQIAAVKKMNLGLGAINAYKQKGGD